MRGKGGQTERMKFSQAVINPRSSEKEGKKKEPPIRKRKNRKVFGKENLLRKNRELIIGRGEIFSHYRERGEKK